jgi:DNA-binding transcriptional LysR family regulator
MDWNDIRLFLALVRSGNVRAAAAKAGVSHSTVARRVEAFEKQLGVRLFDRLPSGYAMTPAGEDMLSVAEGVENELDALERRILGQDLQIAGHIRVTMADFLATNLLMPHLAEFTRLHPDIALEVLTTYETLDLTKREADVALRFTAKPPEHLVGRKLANVAFAAYASEDYLKGHDLHGPSSGRWIGFRAGEAFPKWVQQSRYPDIPVKSVFESVLLQLEACKAGMGLGMLPCFLGDTAPELRRVSAISIQPVYDLWLLSHRDMRTTARIRVFSGFIATAIKSCRTRLEGAGAT